MAKKKNKKLKKSERKRKEKKKLAKKISLKSSELIFKVPKKWSRSDDLSVNYISTFFKN